LKFLDAPFLYCQNLQANLARCMYHVVGYAQLAALGLPVSCVLAREEPTG